MIDPTLDDQDDDSTVVRELKRNGRIAARRAARVFSTPDGQAFLADLKRMNGWDQAGPIERDDASVREWIGMRRVIDGIQRMISQGRALNGNPKYENDE